MSPTNFVVPNPKTVFARRLLKAAGLIALSLLMLWRWDGAPAESASAAAPLAWTPAPPMSEARYIPSVSLLPSGKVLVAGGYRTQGNSFSTTVNIFDPTGAGSWTVAKPLPKAHRITAQLLNTGEVLVVGDDDFSETTASSYLYNEAANDWAATANVPSIRRYATALATLPNGRVMMIGGYNGGCCSGPSGTFNTCEFYDPATKLWSAAPAMATSRLAHTATTLPNGNVLVVGGALRDPVTARNSTEFFNPTNNNWTTGATLAAARYYHTATLLPDGRVLAVGGTNGSAVLNSVEILSTSGVWSNAAPLSVARQSHTATLLPSGKVLVVGGVNLADAALNSAELYDPATNQWENAGPLGGPRGRHIAQPLPCGRVLIAGGQGANSADLATAEIFTQTEAVHTISPMTLSNGVTGTAYNATFTATGGMAPYTFSVINGLPDGLMLNANGTLNGTPAAAGNFSFTIMVTDKNGCTTQKRYTVNISCTTLTLTPASLPNGTAGTPYGQSFTTTGGTAPYAYMLTSGELPPGLTLSPGGQLAGTPNRCGRYPFSIKVTDRYGCMITREFVVDITSNIQITPMTLTPVQQGIAFTQTLTASGGCGNYNFSFGLGSPYPWLTLTSQGILSGTPPQAGTFPITVLLTDRCGCTIRKNFDIVVTQGCATATKPTTYRGGRMDNYVAPLDPATRSPQLNAAFPTANWQGYDSPSENHFLGQSFYVGCRTIVRAELEIHMKPLTSITDNDTLYLGLTNSSGQFAWAQRIFALPGAGGNWDSAAHPTGKLFVFDLANLPMGLTSSATNLLSKMNADGRLDILVQDDTSVDYIKLRVWCCPGRRIFEGYPYDVIGQAEAFPTAAGALSLRNFGASGNDGATLELGATDGWQATVDLTNPQQPAGSELLFNTTALTDTGEESVVRMRILLPPILMPPNRLQIVLEPSSDTPPSNTSPVQLDFYGATGQSLGSVLEGGAPSLTIEEPGIKFTVTAKKYSESRSNVTRSETGITFVSPQTVMLRGGRKFPGVTRLFAGFNTSKSNTKDHPTIVRISGKGVRQVDLSKLVTQMPDSRFLAQTLGAATIEPFPGGVAVANLGTSGADGISVGLGRANSANFGLDALDPLDLAPIGAFLEANVLGIVSGTPNRSLGTFRMTKKAKDQDRPQVQLDANFSTIGSTTHRVQVFNGATMVADLPGRSGQIVGTSSNWPRKLGKLGGQLECFTSDYPNGTFFTIGAQNYTGNNLRVLAELPAASLAPEQNRIEAKTDFILRGSGLGEFILTDSDAVPVCAGSASLTPNSLPEALQNVPYQALLTASGGQVPYLFDVTGLPAGLELLPGGALVGKATQAGTFNLAFTIADDNGCTTTRNYPLTVKATSAAASVSAASYGGTRLAPDEIIAAFGANLATETVIATTTPLPTTLAGTTVKLIDSANVEHPAPLFFVSAGQVNYLIPANAALGETTVIITSGMGTVSVQTVNLARIAPGLFSMTATGRGPAATNIVRARDGVVSYEASVRFDTATNQFVLIPVDLGGESEQVFLVAYGTGARGRTALVNVTAKVGGLDARVDYAGAQGLAGLDQFNILLPRALAGRGVVEVTLTVDGQTTNAVQISIK